MTYEQASLLLDGVLNLSWMILCLQLAVTGQLGYITYLLIRIRRGE